jgi:hypothetical protein
MPNFPFVIDPSGSLPSSTTEFFNPADGSLWDVAFLDGAQVPGLVTCVPKTARKIDVANGPGLDSATLRFQGMDPASFSLTIMVWTEAQQTQLEALLAKVAPRPGRITYANSAYTNTSTAGKDITKRPASFSFSHPAAALAGISQIVVESVSWYDQGPVPQSRSVTLECKQSLPPKKTIAGTPQINTANLGGVAPASPAGLPSGSSGAKGP